MMLETMSLERYDREPEARYRNQTGSHLNDSLQSERRPQRLYLFCNGNRHFKGKVVLVNMRQYRNFGDFLSDVTNRLQPTLPLAHGVRQVFTPVNGRRLRRLSDLEDGQSYVCAGFETFKPMPYEDLTDKSHAPPIGGKRKKSLRENTKSDSARSSTLDPSPRSSQPPPPHPARPYVARQRAIRGHDVTPAPPGSKVRPRIITIYRNGSNPLQNVKILFNRKSVQSYEQFLNDVSDAFESSSTSSLRSNRLRKLISVGGRDVGGVSDLFRDDEFFIGTGPERVKMDTVRQALQLLYPNSVYGDTLMSLWEKRLTDPATAGGVGISEKPVVLKADLDGGGTGTETEEGASVQPRRRKGPKMPRRFMERRAEETARLSNFSVLPSIQDDRHGHVTGNGASTEVQAERRRAELSRFNSSRRSSAAGDAKVFQGQVRGNLGHRSGDVSRPKVTLGLPKEREGRTVVTDGTNRGPAGSEPLKGAQNTEAPFKDTPEVVPRPGTASRHRDPPATLTRDSRICSPPLTHRQRSGDRIAKNQSEPHEDSVNNNNNTNENSWNNEDNEIDTVRTLSGVDSPRGNATPEPVVPGFPTDADEGSRMSPEGAQTPVEGNQTPVATHQRHVSSYLVIEENYELGRILGDGNFAVVKHCKERETGKEFAMKVVDKVKLRGKEDLIENEILIMKACHHQNIVKLFLEYETNSEIFLLMELVGGGDLFDFISQHAPFNEVEAAGMVYDLAKALAYLHSRSVVHRDVKPENIVVQHGDSDLFCLKLADFGLATEVRGPLSTVCGTPTYVAPEILAEIGYGLEIDMWATGVILYILLCGFAPFRGEDPDQLDLFEAIKSGEFEFTSPYWDKASDGVRDLITHLLQVDARKRYTAIDVICHPFIVTCAGTFNPPNMEQLRYNLRNELNKDALVHRNSFAAVLAQLK